MSFPSLPDLSLNIPQISQICSQTFFSLSYIYQTCLGTLRNKICTNAIVTVRKVVGRGCMTKIK